MRPLWYCSVLMFGLTPVLFLGCSAGGVDTSNATLESNPQLAATVVSQSGEAPPNSSTDNTSGSSSPKSAPLPAERKLIYQGEVQIRCEDISEFEKQLSKKLGNVQGFVSGYSEQRVDQTERRGNWVVRIPVNQFESFVNWLDNTGYVLSKSIRSQDVTEQFIDLQARLANKRKTEGRLSEHLAKSTTSVQQILELDREIERVREDIERLEGKLRYLSEQSALSTLTLKVESNKTFAAPQSPTALAQIGGTFYNSTRLLILLFYWLILVVVALLPFAIVALPLLLFGLSRESSMGQKLPLKLLERWRTKT